MYPVISLMSRDSIVQRQQDFVQLLVGFGFDNDMGSRRHLRWSRRWWGSGLMLTQRIAKACVAAAAAIGPAAKPTKNFIGHA